MNVSVRSKKASMNFYSGDMLNMIRDDFKPKGWNTYQESPYKEYYNALEELGYEGHDKPRNNSQDSRDA